MTLNNQFALNSVLRRYLFGTLKHGFRSLASLKLVVNVVGERETEKNSYGIARFPCDSTAFLLIWNWLMVETW